MHDVQYRQNKNEGNTQISFAIREVHLKLMVTPQDGQMWA
jgi:hypothetical protein